MLWLELVFVLIGLAFLVAQNVRGVSRTWPLALLVAGLATLVASGALGELRWQMAPAYLVFATSSLFLLRRAYSHIAVRSIGMLLGVVLLAISVTLSLGIPVLTLPAPAGPYAVGSTSLSLVDASRDNAFFGAPAEQREVYVQVWYPGDIMRPEPRPKTLWEELHRGELDRFTFFTRYLRAVKTHSYADIPLSSDRTTYPVIVFSHAIVSFAEQNTLLMEHLASHGYVVVGLSHPYASMRALSSQGRAIYPNLAKVNEATAQSSAVDAELEPRIEQAASTEERAELHVQRFERATAFGELIAIWVDDLEFALDAVPKQRAFEGRLDVDRVGMLGMSFGGGAITEFCKADARCGAAINMDGGTYGHRQREPLRVPYLALIRSDGPHSLDYLKLASRSDYYELEVAGATHLDFTDDTFALPILRWFGMSGSTGGWRIIEITNAVALEFFDGYLRGGPKPRFDGQFAEVAVEQRP
jgi:predicted dienelactone hydrolase